MLIPSRVRQNSLSATFHKTWASPRESSRCEVHCSPREETRSGTIPEQMLCSECPFKWKPGQHELAGLSALRTDLPDTSPYAEDGTLSDQTSP